MCPHINPLPRTRWSESAGEDDYFLTDRRFTVFNLAKREKSRSHVRSAETPLCRQIAAIRASWVIGPVTCAVDAVSWRRSKYPGPSPITSHLGDSAHRRIASSAVSRGEGGQKIRGWVTMPTNSCTQGHGMRAPASSCVSARQRPYLPPARSAVEEMFRECEVVSDS